MRFSADKTLLTRPCSAHNRAAKAAMRTPTADDELCTTRVPCAQLRRPRAGLTRASRCGDKACSSSSTDSAHCASVSPSVSWCVSSAATIAHREVITRAAENRPSIPGRFGSTVIPLGASSHWCGAQQKVRLPRRDASLATVSTNASAPHPVRCPADWVTKTTSNAPQNTGSWSVTTTGIDKGPLNAETISAA